MNSELQSMTNKYFSKHMEDAYKSSENWKTEYANFKQMYPDSGVGFDDFVKFNKEQNSKNKAYTDAHMNLTNEDKDTYRKYIDEEFNVLSGGSVDSLKQEYENHMDYLKEHGEETYSFDEFVDMQCSIAAEKAEVDMAYEKLYGEPHKTEDDYSTLSPEDREIYMSRMCKLSVVQRDGKLGAYVRSGGQDYENSGEQNSLKEIFKSVSEKFQQSELGQKLIEAYHAMEGKLKTDSRVASFTEKFGADFGKDTSQASASIELE